MRRNAVASQYRPEARMWSVVTFGGGPLNGLRIRVLPDEAARGMTFRMPLRALGMATRCA